MLEGREESVNVSCAFATGIDNTSKERGSSKEYGGFWSSTEILTLGTFYFDLSEDSREEAERKFNALNDYIKNRGIKDAITILQKEMAIMKESHKTGKLDANSFSKENWISLVSLIATVAGAIVVPFTQLPILDYTVRGPSQAETNGTQKDITRSEIDERLEDCIDIHFALADIRVEVRDRVLTKAE